MLPRKERIGRVEILSERMNLARDMSSCCIGVEAYLDLAADRRITIGSAEDEDGRERKSGWFGK